MILPQGMTHQVSTPEEPGYSVHLLFAVTDEPIPKVSNGQSAVPLAT
jgi:hypothetical protein